MAYVCAQCGRTAKLPDFCCGKSMVTEGAYVCRSCGKTAQNEGRCCGQTMVRV